MMATLFEETVEVLLGGGCPQGGVFPLLWNLVIHRLIADLNSVGYYIQEYADDLSF
jgi:hypothetical protein